MIPRAVYWRRIMEALRACPAYVWGGKSLSGMDCSGLVTWAIYEASGHALDYRHTHNTDKIWTEFPRIKESEILPGDCALYFGESSKGPDDVSHVMVCAGFGLVVGMAHGGPKDTIAAESRTAGKIIMVRDIHYRADLAGFIRPPVAP